MSVLLDPRIFPGYNDLPYENDVEPDYYTQNHRGVFEPRRHWCFMGEIVDDTHSYSAFLRHRMNVRDRDGAVIPVFFYLEADIRETFDATVLKNGNTLFARYAQQHSFMDGSEGLRLEEPELFRVVPFSMEAILDAYQESDGWAQDGKVCRKCEAKATHRCGKCKKAFYCTRECQTDHWKAHRPTCKILTAVGPVTALDHTRFTDFVLFT
ncbi:hypothetical protein BGZ98_003912 [Dissophora globulifera]|nr:hypothetical protein BGZ98_003912 [Dissophora globulifera]